MCQQTLVDSAVTQKFGSEQADTSSPGKLQVLKACRCGAVTQLYAPAMAPTLCRHLCAHCCPVLPGILFATADHLQHGLDKSPSGYTASLCQLHRPSTLYLLPILDCHSASKKSSWGVQEPVFTALPFTCVGIGMAAEVALHCSICFETAQYSTCAVLLLQDSGHIQLPIKFPD